MRIREEFVFKHFMRNRRSFLSSYAVKGNIDVARDTISDREMTVAGCETACGQLIIGKRDPRRAWYRAT
jgi:hypothetical protein